MSQTIQHSVRFTREDLDRMVEAGVFANRKERIELLAGELQMMSPASSEHDDVIRYRIGQSIAPQCLPAAGLDLKWLFRG